MIKPLTSLRFFAAAMVLAHHYFGFRAGYSGVTFFYVLSGYVLALSYSGKVATPEGRRLFWWKRFARIYPTHLLTLIACVPLGSSLFALAPNLLLLHSWVPSQGVYYSFDSPSWSISDEAAFYAVFPFLLPWLTRRRLIMWGVGLLAFTAAIAVLEPSWTFGGPLYRLTLAGHSLEAPPLRFLLYVFPPARAFEFALGIGLALWAKDRTIGTLGELAALGLCVASIALYYIGIAAAFAVTVLYIPAACAVIYVFSRSAGKISTILSAPILVLLGDASFMLYMIHWPLRQYLSLPPVAVALIAVALSVALHLWFERPIQTLLLGIYGHDRFSPSRRGHASAALAGEPYDELSENL